MNRRVGCLVVLGLNAVLMGAAAIGSEPVRHRWMQTASFPASEAHQAAAADDRFFYAISSTVVARFDRKTGRKLAMSDGEAQHLNSGFLHQRQLYCAHSNFPHKPEQSSIKVVDLATMKLSEFKDFGDSPPGSLTWAVDEEGHWWCNFAHYGDANVRTVLVKYDRDWRELQRWTYPAEVIARLGRNSISGGLFLKGELLVTGHDHRELYRLKVPAEGTVLEYIATEPAPFTGQGIAIDPQTGSLTGIHRKERRVLFAERQTVSQSPESR